MKRTMVYLEDDMHEGLRQLAFDHNLSMAELIRRAVSRAYGEILEDIRDAEEELAAYVADPSTSVSLEELLSEASGVRTRGKLARSA